MSTALAERPVEALTSVTSDQLELIKRTIAKDATPDELKLYLYDCARQGVHPLDKLVHFTKRAGKYTPITSIDFMRIRAADSGEMAGSDDPVYTGDPEEQTPPVTATVTVYRLTQGLRFAYTATARWAEYKPEQNDFMWRKMPHTMLAKCAEALALRKGFPRQLAGLYAKEEMAQSDDSGYVVEAPTSSSARTPDLRSGDSSSTLDVGITSDNGPDLGVDLPTNALYVERVTKKPTKNVNVTKFTLVLSDGREVSTIRDRMAGLAEQLCQNREPVAVKTSHGKWGEELLELQRASVPSADSGPLDSGEIF